MCTDSSVMFLITDPQGNKEMGVGNGVSRDVYTSFWKKAAHSLLIGETEQVPYVQHKLFNYEWEAIGNILFKAYVDTGCFLVNLSKAFVLYALFGEVGVDDLLLLFLSSYNDEANMLRAIIAEESSINDFSSELTEISRNCKARTNSKTTCHECMLESNV